MEKVFKDAWFSGDETPRDLTDLAKHGRHHWKKLMQAASYAEDTEGFVADLRFFRRHAEVDLHPSAGGLDPQRYIEYLHEIARDSDTAKQRGFYVDLGADGSLSVPHAIDRPNLEEEIKATGVLVELLLFDLQLHGTLLAAVQRGSEEEFDEIRARLRPVTGGNFSSWF